MSKVTELVEKLRGIAEFVDSGIHMQGGDFDCPPQPASQWDYFAGQAVQELHEVASALEAALSQGKAVDVVESDYVDLPDIFTDPAGDTVDLCGRTYLRSDVEAALAATGKQSGSERERFEAWLSERPYMSFAGYAWEAWQAATASREAVGVEPVAVIGSDFTICWVGSGPIAPLVERNGIKKGSFLYAAPPTQQESKDE